MGNTPGAVVARETSLTVDARSEVLAVNADPSSIIFTSHVETQAASIHRGIIHTRLCMAMTVTGFTCDISYLFTIMSVAGSPSDPGLLVVQGAADLTVVTTRVVLANTRQSIRSVAESLAFCGVPIADTLSSNRDILDRVEIPSCNNRI